MGYRTDAKVYLVGAGPGDPGLITVRGMRLLERAEVVVYDALANPELLKHCPVDVEKIYVGKRAAAHTMTQAQINALLVEKGREGKRVVRLKGGDPFVFGRGGEECEALAAAGVAFEVVPGITAAIAAPAYAGIPVTHRDFNSSFTLVTGHEREEGTEARRPEGTEARRHEGTEARRPEGTEARRHEGRDGGVDWPVIARLPCVAFYMGVKALPRICAKLVEHGMEPSMPAATIRWGTTARQRTVVGTVADLPQRVAEAKLAAPALTIIGRVVSMRETLNWFERRPLFGQTVVVTRTRQQASELSARLSELGARVIEAPTIEVVPPADWGQVDEALARAGGYDWVIFTSVNGVRAVKERLRQTRRDVRVFGDARVAAVGEATAAAVAEELALRVDLCPGQFVAEALAEALIERGEVAGKRLLLLRADIGRPILVERIRAVGAAVVDDVAVYETKPSAGLPGELIEALEAGEVTWMTFTSSSTAKNLARLLGENDRERLKAVKLASIGPVTTAALRELGLEPAVEAAPATVEGLVEAILGVHGTSGI